MSYIHLYFSYIPTTFFLVYPHIICGHTVFNIKARHVFIKMKMNRNVLLKEMISS